MALRKRALEASPALGASEADQVERRVLGEERRRIVEALEDVSHALRQRLGVRHAQRELLTGEHLEQTHDRPQRIDS